MAIDDLKKTLISAMGWSLAVKVGFQVVTWALTLVVIRVLAPSDYGLMATAQIFANFMLGFGNLGLGDALVQRRDASDDLIANAFGALLVMSLALNVALALAAYPIAHWYGDHRLVALVQVSSLGFLFNALTTVPRMSLTKRMQVRPIFLAELSSGLAGSVLVLILAFSGYGVWALMGGWLATNIVRLAAYVLVAPASYVLPRFAMRGVAPLLGFGAYSTLEFAAFTAMTSADVLIVGRLLGERDLGLYAVVLNFAAMPVNKVAPIVNSVAFPAFAMVQDRQADARFYVVKALRMMAILAVPVFIGISLTAPEIVDLVFGPAWAAARPLLEILAVALTFRALLVVPPNFLQGIGNARAAFWCTAWGAVVIPLAVLIGCRWGIEGACWAWLAAYPLVFLGEAAIAAHQGSLSLRTFLETPLRPFIAGAVMAACVSLARLALPAGLPAIVRLGVLAAAGAATYTLFIVVAFPELGRELRNLLPGRKSAVRSRQE